MPVVRPIVFDKLCHRVLFVGGLATSAVVCLAPFQSAKTD